jgi:hypothetical protein
MSAAFQFSGGSEHTTTRAPSAFPTGWGVKGLDAAGRTRPRDTSQIRSGFLFQSGQIPWQVSRLSVGPGEAHQSFPFRAPFNVMKGAGKCRDETTATTR